jgi:DnaJ-class molecular chaperone
MRTDPWRVLGLARGASLEDARRAFRRLAWELHPDRRPNDPGAEARFKELVEALGTLSIRGARAETRVAGARVPTPAPVRGAATAEVRRPGSTARGSGVPVAADYEVSLAEALRGGPHAVRLRVRVPCAACEGRRRRRSDCRACAGSGLVPVERRLVFRLPAGARDGDEVTLPGSRRGGSTAGTHGPLSIRLVVRPPPGVLVEGDDVHVDLPLTVAEAAFGARIPVPAPGGEVPVTLPPLVDPTTVLRLRGRGLPPREGRSGRPGDLLLRPVLVLPARRDAAVLALLRELAATYTEDPRAALRRCFV